MKKLNVKVKQAMWDVYFKLNQLKTDTIEALSNKDGEAYIDTVVKILIAVVIGSIIFVAIYSLMNETVITNMKDKVGEMFGYYEKPKA